MQLTTALQEALLALLCYDGDAAGIIVATIPPRAFDPFYADIAEQAATYVSRYKQPPGAHLLDIIDTLKARFPANAEFYERIYTSLGTTKDSINREFILERASAWVNYKKMQRGIVKAADLLKRNDETSLLEARGVLADCVTAADSGFDVGTKLTDTDRSLKFLESNFEAMPTGIASLDARNLGPSRKRLSLFVALPGRGKSWYLVSLAKRALLAGLRTVYVTLELGEEEVCQRLMQSFFSVGKRREPVPVSRFRCDELGRFVSVDTTTVSRDIALADTDIARTLKKKLKRLEKKPPLIVREFPTSSLTPGQLEAYLDALESVEGFYPDLLLLDYADLMAIDPKNVRTETGQIYKKLRGIAVKRNIAVVSATQANRAAVGARVITLEHLSEDFSKGAIADVVITYNQTQAEYERGLARLFVAKGRTDADKFTVVISQAYPLGQFCMSEAGLISSYWDAVDGSVAPETDS